MKKELREMAKKWKDAATEALAKCGQAPESRGSCGTRKEKSARLFGLMTRLVRAT